MRALVSLSGGLDSTTLLAYALEEGREVATVGFCYGTKHNRHENLAAQRIAEHYQVPFRFVDVASAFTAFHSDLLQTGGAIPEGHYEDEKMRQTVVPCRNLIFLAVLSGLAESLGYGEVWFGMHRGDSLIYPDCRPEFVHHASAAVGAATDHKVRLLTPFLFWDKAAVLRWGLHGGTKNPPPYQLTRTCYTDQETACGRCGACQERLEAFQRCEVEDPLPYASRELLAKK